MPLIGDKRREEFDWVRFWVRFACGMLLGSVLGFGFWVQMCRPAHSLGLGEWFPQQLAEWLGVSNSVDSGLGGFVVVLIFALATGTITAVWRSAAK